MMAARQAWLEIDLDAIAHNISIMKEYAGEAALAAVVKANAYGHGAPAVAEAALAAGAQRLCVFNLDEAAALRSAGLDAPILVLGYAPPADSERALELGVALTVSHDEVAQALSAAATARNKTVAVHVKLEAGMYRFGVRAEEALELATSVRALPGLKLEGVCALFPSADGPDPTDTEARFAQFVQVADRVGAPSRHVANTAALLRFPHMALEMVRPGIGMYGILTGVLSAETFGLRPALQWKARIIQVHDVPAGESVSYGGAWTAGRDSRIGVVAVGYGDGFPRSLGGRGEMLVEGRRAPVVGTVCMDMCMVDLTDGPDVAVGDVAVVVGRDGGERIRLEDVATNCGTIPHEICVGLGDRLPRVYLRSGRPVSVQTLLDRVPVPTTAPSAKAAVLTR